MKYLIIAVILGVSLIGLTKIKFDGPLPMAHQVEAKAPFCPAVRKVFSTTPDRYLSKDGQVYKCFR